MTRKSTILVMLAIGAVALVAGVYGLYDPQNGSHAVAAAGMPAASEAETTPGISRELSTGTLTAFVVHPERKPVPDIAFQNAEGQALQLSDWRGRVVLVNLWATWCGPCRKEMPELAELQERLGSAEFEVVAINVDRQGAEVARPFLQKIGVEALSLYLDPSSKVLTELRAVGLPATLLVDRSGREIGRMLGPAEWASPEAVRLIEAALGEPRAS